MSNEKHAGRAHALLGASGASRWINCPPSARLQETVPDRGSAFADQGTAAHELAEMMLSQLLLGKDESALIQRFKEVDPHYDAEMESAIGYYVEVIAELYNTARARSEDAVLLLEERLDFSQWVPDGFGTGDVVIIADGVLTVADLKFGKGVPVSALGNSQMRLYALGAYNAYSYLYDISEIHMTIVQPRLDSVSTDTVSVEDLLAWAEGTVKPAAALADKGEGEFKSGEHCRWCKIKGNCRARADEQMKLIAHEFRDPALLSIDEIGNILTISEHLAAWAKDVADYAFDQAKSGQAIPGWKLVEGRSNRAISDKEEAMTRLASEDALRIDQYQKPPELLGIGELEKRIGKKDLTALIGDLIVKPPGKPVLVVETDKRPALNSVESIFNNEEFETN